MDNVSFQETVVDKIHGWLNRVTSLRTMDILCYQEEHQLVGPLMEIGVLQGKYFSVLARSAQRANSRLLGIDTFQWNSESKVRETLAMSSETNRVDLCLLKVMSSECSPGELLELLGDRPRFVSIDGSHECEDVYLDLVLCEEIISNRGIIAIDDFLNPIALGVNEAVHKFFAHPRLVVPVAFISNKLFVAHRSIAAEYKRVIEESIVEDQVQPESKKFRESLLKDRSRIEQSLWGSRLLIG